MGRAKRVAVVGGGWAGLAAAIHATEQGHAVTLYEMARHWGGRARHVDHQGARLDNGQHILIGAYTESLALMDKVGLRGQQSFLRTPLRISYPDGAGLKLPGGPPILAFARAVMRYQGWPWRDKAALLSRATRWALTGFECAPQLSVAQLTAGLPRSVCQDLIDPLCVAALNTLPPDASGQVFLRVLKDALFSAPGSADLLLPRLDLSALLPEPAAHWLRRAGANLRPGCRVESIERGSAPSAEQWRIEGEYFDGVVLACSCAEAARLAAPFAPEWAQTSARFRYEPIVTVYARSPGSELPEPMMALQSSLDAPAQFVFDLGRLRGLDGLFAFVISGARDWVARGTEITQRMTLQQGQAALSRYLRAPLESVQVFTEKRATFLCTPGLNRPARHLAPGLSAAGDYIAGPYPATLEGAVRSGRLAVEALFAQNSAPNRPIT